MSKGKSPGDDLPVECSQAYFATLVNSGSRNVQDLIARGILPRNKSGKIKVLPALHAYMKHLREQASGRKGEGGLDLATVRAELEQEKLVEQRLRNDQMRAKTVPVDQAREEFSRIATQVRLRVTGLTNKIRTKVPTLTQHDGEVIADLCREVLEDIASDSEGSEAVTVDAKKLKP